MRLHNFLQRLDGLTQRILTALWYRWRFGGCGARLVIAHHPRMINPHLMFLGNRISVGPLVRLEVHPQNGNSASLVVGDDSIIEHGVHIYAASHLTIGKHALIASGCMITDNNHGHHPPAGGYARQKLIATTTTLGDNVWLGENVAVLPGSLIGDNVIVGANSVVNGVLPPNCIAVGSPAKPVKTFDQLTQSWVSVRVSEQ